jgi:hypothetical protein
MSLKGFCEPLLISHEFERLLSINWAPEFKTDFNKNRLKLTSKTNENKDLSNSGHMLLIRQSAVTTPSVSDDHRHARFKCTTYERQTRHTQCGTGFQNQI